MTITTHGSTDAELEAFISATRLRLRMKAPFFAALALFAEVSFTEDIPIAATDGKTLFFHPRSYGDLPAAQRDAVFLHELLHAALLHPMRRGIRDPELFNIAADIVVNGMVGCYESLALPNGAFRNTDLEHLSVEEIYEILQKQSHDQRPTLTLVDLLTQPLVSEPVNGEGIDQEAGITAVDEWHSLHDRQDLEAHWKQAIQQAEVLARSQGKGDLPAGLLRHLDEVAEPQLDWRSQLWRFLVRTPNDYCGFDRRFFHQGLYLDHLEGESVEVFCCIDTSGSVGPEELRLFLAELKGILAAYPMLRCLLWYADASCYGPYELTNDIKIPPPKGGGGTDFRPFFRKVSKLWTGEKESVCIYLTDGYGDFPKTLPELQTLWIVVPGGLDSADFPWGEVVRLI